MSSPSKQIRAVFLDRDGVLIEDVDWLTRPEQIRVLPGVPQALRGLAQAGFRLIVVTNQPIIARGMATEAELATLHAAIAGQLAGGGAPLLDRFYYCPHHPRATLPAYRVVCECRKPRPGMLLRAAKELDLDLRASFMVGDRITDIAAGAAAGCRTVMVQTGKHLEPTIHTTEPIDPSLKPDWTCADLPAAAEWILKNK
jgi:D-glycero-D-manno-heptose 1,7-bisphosphate phosphatase